MPHVPLYIALSFFTVPGMFLDYIIPSAFANEISSFHLKRVASIIASVLQVIFSSDFIKWGSFLYFLFHSSAQYKSQVSAIFFPQNFGNLSSLIKQVLHKDFQ